MTLANSGGHSMHPTFFLNPQYSLSVQPLPNSGSSSSFIRITLQGGKDAPLNVMVLWGRAKRITDVDQGDIVLDSGAYSYGIACASGPMKPGSAPLEVVSIPPEGSGRFTKLLKGSWEGNTSITYQITVLKPTTIQIRLQCIEAGPRAPIGLSVTTADSTLIRGVEAATPILSVGWNDTISGILTDHTPLPAGSFLVKASTTQAGIGRRLVLTIYSSACAVSGVITN
ncbi:hypothetical protein DL93DRAFT_1261177 [Clavulina sp. PMI_390]|nr:hypothetical protein DL93DRAFT_1261177 [Clavulina sp. PMI_390]